MRGGQLEVLQYLATDDGVVDTVSLETLSYDARNDLEGNCFPAYLYKVWDLLLDGMTALLIAAQVRLSLRQFEWEEVGGLKETLI